MAPMGMGGMMPPGPPGNPMQGPGVMTPGAGSNPMAGAALGSMDMLKPKSSNPGEAMAQVEKAMDMAHQLIMSSLSQISQWHPKLTKDLHELGRKILAAKIELNAEQPIMPPPDLMMGMGADMGPSGMPPTMGLGSPGGMA